MHTSPPQLKKMNEQMPPRIKTIWDTRRVRGAGGILFPRDGAYHEQGHPVCGKHPSRSRMELGVPAFRKPDHGTKLYFRSKNLRDKSHPKIYTCFSFALQESWLLSYSKNGPMQRISPIKNVFGGQSPCLGVRCLPYILPIRVWNHSTSKVL